MNRILFLTISIVCLYIPCKAQPYSIPNNVKRIVFLGNSITYMGQYISYIDMYFTVTYPDKDIEFINVGLPSETVSGLSEPGHAEGEFPRPDLHERLDRILTKTKPDLIFACYGMNDGIYMPFDSTRFKRYREGINWLHDKVTELDIPIIHLTPPIYDERNGKAYANVLDIYSDWLLSRRYTDNWEVIDIHWPMKKYLQDRRVLDPSFRYAKDGVHPNEIGHFIMAKQILLSLGETAIEGATDINDALSECENPEAIIELVEKQQVFMKDAWLTNIGHKRPGMKIGLPLEEAIYKNDSIDELIFQYLH